jgi:MFS family permease
MCIGLLFQAMAYAPESATLAELFPTKMRYLGVSFSYQFASILAGSMAPIICAYLFKTYDATLPIEIYIAIVSFISVLAVASLKESKGIDLKDVK